MRATDIFILYLNVFSTKSNTFTARLKRICVEIAGTSVFSDITSRLIKLSEL